jgi:hypothetical protein
MDPNFLTWPLVQTYASTATYTLRATIVLGLWNYIENQAYFKNKYF